MPRTLGLGAVVPLVVRGAAEDTVAVAACGAVLFRLDAIRTVRAGPAWAILPSFSTTTTRPAADLIRSGASVACHWFFLGLDTLDTLPAAGDVVTIVGLIHMRARAVLEHGIII